MAVTELVNSGNYSNGRYLYRFTDSGSSDEDSAWSVAEDPQLCETQSLCDATDRLELGPHKVEDDDAAPLLDPRFYNECEEQYLLDNYEVVQQACRDQIATFITQEGSEALQRMLSDRWDFLPNPDPLMAILRFYVLSLRVCSRGSADSLHMKQLLSLLRVSDGIGLALDVLDTMRKENSPPDVKIADMTAMTVQILARMIKDDVEFHCEVHNMQQFAALKNHVMHKNMPYCSSTIRAQSAWRSLTALLRYRAQQGQPEDIPTPTGTTASGMLTPRLSKPVSYDFYMELPGHLSLLGPRHSNDHADIRDIAVAPTLDEIMCPRPAYLPQLDHLAWYVEGMEEHPAPCFTGWAQAPEADSAVHSLFAVSHDVHWHELWGRGREYELPEAHGPEWPTRAGLTVGGACPLTSPSDAQVAKEPRGERQGQGRGNLFLSTDAMPSARKSPVRDIVRGSLCESRGYG
ncbi:hypothetical protein CAUPRSCDRAFT_12190 [Caulochytrium protostelioides]|uniref:Uncharacterized protein n=1 Tax=Caulochytrium protostelioides TaxID=1555241 RepID=A0A4P9WSB7_9FUNG|nr:hypothetical protein CAUPRSCDRAFT_12190 [Caulochytrium protostelioides]